MSIIEYFYAAHSGFAYLGSARFMAIASAAERRIVHKPIDLGRVIAAAGATTFRQRSDRHRAYFFGREIQRWSQFRQAPVINGRPTHHDNDITLANCMIIAGIDQGLIVDHLAHAMLEAHWRYDADLADQSTLSALCSSVGVDPAPLIAAARSHDTRQSYAANTAEAIARSVFGSPTYFVDGDMFYGQDHLDLVERALREAFT
jgi:2-hydroxychromene-2-carboxylate isomerase